MASDLQSKITDAIAVAIMGAYRNASRLGSINDPFVQRHLRELSSTAADIASMRIQKCSCEDIDYGNG